MRKILVFVMVLSLSVMLLGCSGTDTSKEANDTTQNTKQEENQGGRLGKLSETFPGTEGRTARHPQSKIKI